MMKYKLERQYKKFGNMLKNSKMRKAKELEEIKPDETGKKDFESLEAMDLSLFTKEIILHVQSRMGEHFHISSTTVKKNNGIILTGIIIREKDSNLSPTIYLNEFFSCYQNGMDLQQIADRICDAYQSNDIGSNVDLSGFINYETAKRMHGVELIDISIDKVCKYYENSYNDYIFYYILVYVVELGSGLVIQFLFVLSNF
mgnify:CR=1 FL=1